MKQPLDDLFRDKFEQHMLPAPEAAWSRIDSNLNNHHRQLYLRLAAALIPVAVVGYALWSTLDTASNQEQATIARVAAAAPDNSSKVEIPATTPIESPVQVKRKTEAPVRTIHRHETAIVDNTSNTANQEIPSIELEPATEVAAVAELHTTVEQPEEAVASTSNVLVVAVEEVNQKYLIQPSVLNATPDVQNASSLQKLLEKASDLKHTTGLSSLRQAKNEILALNFRSKKRERNN